MKWKKGQKYELTQPWKDHYDGCDDGEGNPCVGYHYAKAAHTGEFAICDCWIVNDRGRVHPGFCNSPVPVNHNSVVR